MALRQASPMREVLKHEGISLKNTSIGKVHFVFFQVITFFFPFIVHSFLFWGFNYFCSFFTTFKFTYILSFCYHCVGFLNHFSINCGVSFFNLAMLQSFTTFYFVRLFMIMILLKNFLLSLFLWILYGTSLLHVDSRCYGVLILTFLFNKQFFYAITHHQRYSKVASMTTKMSNNEIISV